MMGEDTGGEGGKEERRKRDEGGAKEGFTRDIRSEE